MINLTTDHDQKPGHGLTKTTLQITFENSGYSGFYAVEVQGDCRGMELVDRAITHMYDFFLGDNDKASIVLDKKSEGEYRVFYDESKAKPVLDKPKSEYRVFCDEDNRGKDWLSNMVIKVEITACKALEEN